MNFLVNLANSPMVDRLGWALLHSLWQGAAIAMVYGLLRLMLRRYSADARYVLACAALWSTATAPIMSFFCLSPGAVAARLSDFGTTSLFGSGFQVRPYSMSMVSGAHWSLANWNGFLETLLPWMVIAWIIGVLLLSIRLLQGYWQVRRLRTVQTALLDPAWLEALEDLKIRFKVSRPVRLVSSALAEVPMVIGWLHPVILIPVSTLIGLTPAQVVAILAHELAHVRRCDYLVNVFQNVVETILFYHPVVWWISRCIREEREECCDDLVVRICRDRFVYARALFRLEELRGTAGRFAFAASGGSLLGRIRRLLAPAKAAGPISAREIGRLALGGLGGVLVLFGCFLLLGAESYSSTVRMKIEHAYVTPPVARQNASSYDPYFIQTEFEVIQSEVILGKVIEELNLDKEWSRKFGRVLKPFESVELLRRQMGIRPVRNTSILELRVYDSNPVRAADIANKIAETYRNFRKDETSGKPHERLELLLKQVNEQEDAIAKLRNTMAQRNLLQTPDSPQSKETVSPRISAVALRKIEEIKIETQAEYVRSKVLMDRLKTLPPDQLVQAISAAGIEDNLLSQLLEQLTLAKQKFTALTTDYGPQYSQVRIVSNQIDQLQQRIDARREGLLQGLSVRVDSLAKGIADFDNEVARALQANVSQVGANEAYVQAQRDLEDQQEIRKMLLMKIASEKAEVQLPKNPPVQIVDPAFPSSRPATPNRPLAFALMGAGALLGLLGLLLARMGTSGAQVPADRVF